MSKQKNTWDYAESIESIGHINLKKQYGLYINGKWVKPSSKKYFSSCNPHDEEHIADVSKANAKDVDLAVQAADQAFNGVWSKISAAERGKYIFRIARLMQEQALSLIHI